MTGNVGEIVKLALKAQTIALYAHTNPDGDTLGSTLALALALEKAGKKVSLFCDTPIPQKFDCLYGWDKFELPSKVVHDLAISVDCSSLDRLGQCVKSYLSARKQVAIDHHASFQRFADVCLVDSEASACAEIVFLVVKELKALSKETAELLFGAIVTDSGCFAFSSVSAKTHNIAAELMSYGIDASDIIYKVFRSTDKRQFALKIRALAKAKFFEDDKIAVMVFDKSDFEATGTEIDRTEGIINELINIDTVKVAFALSEVGPHHYKLSVRSKSPFNAAEIASYYGGGGHVNAAGCRVNGYVEDIIENIVRLAKDRL